MFGQAGRAGPQDDVGTAVVAGEVGAPVGWGVSQVGEERVYQEVPAVAGGDVFPAGPEF